MCWNSGFSPPVSPPARSPLKRVMNPLDFGDPLTFHLCRYHKVDIITYVAIKFSTDIVDSQRMKCNDFRDHLTFPLVPSLCLTFVVWGEMSLSEDWVHCQVNI